MSDCTRGVREKCSAARQAERKRKIKGGKRIHGSASIGAFILPLQGGTSERGGSERNGTAEASSRNNRCKLRAYTYAGMYQRDRACA